MLGLIFEKAQNKTQDPAKLRQLIMEPIGRENWSAMSADVKGDAYEGLLERNAQDVKRRRRAVLHAAPDDLRSAWEQIEDVLADLQQTPGFRDRTD